MSISQMTNPAIATWFDGESVWEYRGDLPVVIQFSKPVDAMFVCRYPPKESRNFINKLGPVLKVKRWLVLPP